MSPTGGDLGTARGTITIDFDSKGIEEGEARMVGFGKRAEGLTNNQLAGLQQGLRSTSTVALVAGGIIAAAFVAAVKTASDFEYQLSAIQAVSGATADEMDLISEAALRIGKETVFSASESALAMEELVKAGISVTDVLNGAADATVALAAAGGVDLPTAATIAANAMNQYGIAAKDLVGVTDTIAGAANASAIDMNQFAYSLSQVGAVANLAGVSFEDTATAIAVMGNAGIVGSDAGTSLRSMFLRLNPQTEKAADLMRELGIITEDGVNHFYDASGSMKDLASVSQVLQDALAGMTDQQKQATLNVLFGQDAIRGAAILAGEGAAGFRDMAAAMGEITAADVAATRLDNLQGSVEQLKGATETLVITLAQNLTPTIKVIVDAITVAVDWFTNLSAGVQQAIIVGTALAGVLLILYGVLGKMAVFTMELRTALLAATGAQAIFGTVTGGTTVAQLASAAASRAMAAAMYAIPIVAIIGLIGGLLYAIVQLNGGWDEIVRAVQPAFETMKAAVAPLMPIFQELGETIGNTFMAILMALMPILQVLSDTIFPVLISVIGAVAPIIASLAQILAAILGPALGIVSAVIEALAPIITTLLGALTPLIELLMMVLVPVLDVVVWALGLLADAIGWVADVLTDFFQENEQGTSAAGDAWEGFVGWLTTLWDGFVSFFQGIWNGVVAFFTPIIDTITAIFTTLYNAAVAVWTGIMAVVMPVVAWFQEHVAPVFEAFGALIARIFNYVASVIGFVIGVVWAVIQTFIDWFIANVAPVIQAAIDIIVGVFNTLMSVTSAVWGAISGAIGGAVKTAWDTIVAVFGGIVKWFEDTFGPIVDAVKKPIDDAVALVTGIKDTILGFFADAGEWLLQIGEDIIGGLISGIEGALGWLGDVLNGITNMIPEEKGPESVDKVLLKPAGQSIMQGLMAGMQSEFGNLFGMLGGLNVSIPAAMEGAAVGTRQGATTTNSRTLQYYAGDNDTIDSEEKLFESMRRAKVVSPGW